ncbi:MAG: T9SS type A sorting domain-containing protein, partial [Bacteroidales bacterium]|nr:T9SS type A sorting domain-containing protein [Bacteroidales bacterium]
ENTAEDMLYTPRFAITSKGVDSLVFWHYYDTENGSDGGYVQYLNVSGNWSTLGQANDTTAVNWYTDTLNGPEAFSGNSGGWIRSAISIDSSNVPTMASITQFRFVFTSDGSGNGGDGWAIDDLWVKIPKQPIDAGVTAINTPVDSTVVGTQQTVSVDIRNFGLDTLTSIPVTYKVGNSQPVTETWTGSLNPDNTTTFIFSQTYAGPGVDYKLCTYTDLAQDGNNANDTTCRMIDKKTPPYDAGIVAIDPIIQYQGGTTDTTWFQKDVEVKVWIKNFGSNTLTSMDVEYEAGTLTPVTETWTGTLASGDSVEYIFNQTFTSSIGTYTVCGRTYLTNDADPSNDEYCETWEGIQNGIESDELPGFVLYQNKPNPVDEQTSIDFEVPKAGKAEFEVVDMFGRELYTEEMSVNAGSHTVKLNGKDMPSGIYYYSVTFDGHRLVRKMVISK